MLCISIEKLLLPEETDFEWTEETFIENGSSGGRTIFNRIQIHRE